MIKESQSLLSYYKKIWELSAPNIFESPLLKQAKCHLIHCRACIPEGYPTTFQGIFLNKQDEINKDNLEHFYSRENFVMSHENPN